MIYVEGDWLHVGDRRWWGQSHIADLSYNDPTMNWKLRQFVVRFESKWSVSVIWGYATYSDNHGIPWDHRDQVFNETPTLVEAAIIHADRDSIEGGEPFAYIDAEQLNALLTTVSQLGTDERIESIDHDV